MKIKIIPLFCLFQLISTIFLNAQNHLRLWYDEPAADWNEALPVGNGRLGAMVFGNPEQERIQLNEESLWGGSPGNNNNPNARASLPHIRRLILNDSLQEAIDLAEKTLLGTPPRIRSYQPLCDLSIRFGKRIVTDYMRELDLKTGVCRTTYSVEGSRYTQEVFASAPDNVIVVKLKSQGKSKLNFSINLNRTRDARTYSEKNRVFLIGQIEDKADPERGPGGKHMRFHTQLRAYTPDGTIEACENGLRISKAQEVTLMISAVTDYHLASLSYHPEENLEKKCNAIFDRIPSVRYSTLYKRHFKEYSGLFNRVHFSLHADDRQERPTDERLEAIKKGKDDPNLVSLYFQYGRYLLMSCSRYPGVLPANLQGIWNESYNAPWNSDFHTNVNLQMNYWPAEICNLSETVNPLIQFLGQIKRPGTETAREMYGARGWTLHHLTNIFGRTGVMDGVQWGLFPMAGPWMTFPLYEHYLFTKDRKFLQQQGYPLMKGAAQFILDYLVKDKNGYWVTVPSNSPENSYIHSSGKPFKMTYAATMDIQIITELFQNCIEATEILDTDRRFADTLKSVLQHLPPIQISSKTGGIQEWIEDFDEVEPGHRHISHLLGLYPGSQITVETPEQFEAAKKTLARRLSKGGGHTGWSRAWIINFYARLREGEEAHKHILSLLAHSTQKNLFDTHPPFQIDGNFGATAGIAEMLLQSDKHSITLLPALPHAWQNGTISGLKARGNIEAEITWDNGQLSRAVITVQDDQTRTIKAKTPFRYKRHIAHYKDGEYELTISLKKGKSYRLSQ